jgi:steroid delta-isomerase-like uncharacterized protein
MEASVAASQQRVVRVCVALRHCDAQAGGQSALALAVDQACTASGPQSSTAAAAALIARAVAAAHADALGAILERRHLPWSGFEIQTDAACAATPAMPSLDSVAVFPIVFGGDPGRHGEYAAAARQARDSSPVGRAIRGNVAYKVGAVTVLAAGRADGAMPWAVGGDTPRDAGPGRLLQRHLAAFNRHAADQASATIHAECALHDIALGQRFQGPAIAAAYYRSWWDAFDLRLADPRCHYGEAGTVTIEAHCTGTHRGRFRDIAPTGRAIGIRTAAILRLRDGLIAEMRIYYDAGSLLRQLGVAAGHAAPPSYGDLQ